MWLVAIGTLYFKAVNVPENVMKSSQVLYRNSKCVHPIYMLEFDMYINNCDKSINANYFLKYK